MDFATKVRNILKERGVKQRWVGDKVGMKFSVINSRMNGYVDFSDDDMKKIADVLGFDCSEYLSDAK